MNSILLRYQKLTVIYFRSLKLTGISGQKVCYKERRSSWRNTDRSRRYNITIPTGYLIMLSFFKLQEDENDKLKNLLARAKEVLQNGRNEEALGLYRNALMMAITMNDSEHISSIKEKMAAIAFVSKQFSDAEKLYIEVKQFWLGKETPQDEMRLLNINLRLAEIYAGLEDYTKAEQLYQLCADGAKPQLEGLEQADDDFVEFWLLFLTSEAHYYLKRGNIDKAYKYFSRASNLCLKTKGEMHEQTVTLLQQLGSVCYQKGDLEDAVMYLKKATELGRHLPGMTELSNAYISLGSILLVQGLNKEAEAACHQGLKNAKRHKYTQGIKEAESCLKEAASAATSS